MIEATIPVGSPEQIILLFGTSDQHLRRIREAVPAKITTKNGRICLTGDEEAVLQATSIFEQMKVAVGREGALRPDHVAQIIAGVTGGKNGVPKAPELAIHQPGVSIRPRTEGQAAYVEAIRAHELIFCIGPAGTGKTYLAVATAVEAFKQKQIRKIVLVRPAVEAGKASAICPAI